MKKLTKNIGITLAAAVQLAFTTPSFAAVWTFESAFGSPFLWGFDRCTKDAQKCSIYTNGQLNINHTIVSGNTVAIGGFRNYTPFAHSETWTYGTGPRTNFDFNGVYMTSIYDDGVAVRVEARKDGGKYTQVKTVELTTDPTHFDFNFANVDEIKFYAYWIDGPRFNSKGNPIDPLFAIDDFTYNEPFVSTDPGTPGTPGTPSTPVPEPMTLALFGIGLAGMAAGQRRKTRSGAQIAIRAPGIC